MLEIIKRCISPSILLNAEELYQKESHLYFRETDPGTGNPDINISFNPEDYECIGLNFSEFNAISKPITNIFKKKGVERINKLSDGLIIGREKGSEKIFAIMIEMKSERVENSVVRLQLNGTQAIFKYITNLIDLQFEEEELPDITLYRFCFKYSRKRLKLQRNNPLNANWSKSSRSYILGKHSYYDIRYLLGYELPSE